MDSQTNISNHDLRIEALLGGENAISLQAIRAYKYDNRYARGLTVNEVVKGLLALYFEQGRELQAGQNRLKNWNFGTDVDDRAAALGVLSSSSFVMG
jgi:acyl-homoserine lactone acylase PvdQ